MPYGDPYRPVREELGRISGTLERGLSRRAQAGLQRETMQLGHEARMTGLGMQKERLGMETEEHGQKMKLLNIQVSEEEKKQGWLNAEVDFDVLGDIIGEDATRELIERLPGDRTQINESGTATIKTTNRMLMNNFELIKELSPKLHAIEQDKDGNYFGITTKGKKMALGFKGPLKGVTEKLPIRPKTIADLSPTQRRNLSKDFRQAKYDGETEATTLEEFAMEQEILPPRVPVKKRTTKLKNWKDYYTGGAGGEF